MSVFRPIHLLRPACLVAAAWAAAQTPSYRASGPTSSAPSTVPADNSKHNQDPANRDRTADNQKDNAADRTLTQRIRKSVMADKDLSTYAHNVKIISVDGTVTLTGVVRSEQEKVSVAQKAEAVAGSGRVVDQVTIRTASK